MYICGKEVPMCITCEEKCEENVLIPRKYLWQKKIKLKTHEDGSSLDNPVSMIQ